MSVRGIQTPSIDASPCLAPGESITNLTTTLTRKSDGKVITLVDAPVVSGNQILQIIRGTALDAGSVYQLSANFTASPTINEFPLDLEVIANP